MFTRLIRSVQQSRRVCSISGGRRFSGSAAAAATSASPAPYRPRRALLYMPGSNPKMLAKSATLPVDSVCMDLEDAVAANAKAAARQNIVTALTTFPNGLQPNTEWLVRINPCGSGFEQADIDAIITANTAANAKTPSVTGRYWPDGIVLPKVESRDHVRWLADRVPLINPYTGHPMSLILLIESARAVLNLRSICEATPPGRVNALIFGADDFAADIGAVRTSGGEEVAFGRAQTLLHSKAYGMQCIDSVQINFQPSFESQLITESVAGFQLGFTGKQIIHPNQITPVQRSFTPDIKLLTAAKRIVDAHNEHAAKGTGAFTLDNKMIDAPTVKNAEKLLRLGKACGAI